jgi:hypothetical protein
MGTIEKNNKIGIKINKIIVIYLHLLTFQTPILRHKKLLKM